MFLRFGESAERLTTARRDAQVAQRAVALSQAICGFGQPVGKVIREIMRLVLIKLMRRDEFGKRSAIDPTRDIVASRN
jgi:hypothetical protein